MTYTFDVAVSFAGEDRSTASTLAGRLQSRGIKVFYDEFNKANLWGKNLYDELADIYSNRARYCVILISSFYAKKKWTSHERKSAQERAFRENKEYILPVRLDDTEIPGLPETVGYIDLRTSSIEEIVDLVSMKLGLNQKPAAKTQIRELEDQETDLPVGIGWHRTQVRKVLGKPGKSEKHFETYWEYGLIVDYQADRVAAIHATALESGTSFFGYVLGVRIGDTLDRCLEKWGEPSVREPDWPGYEVIEWNLGKYKIRIESWSKDGMEPVFGPYKKGRVKNIVISSGEC